jgi:hypothetical protein
LRYYKYLEAWKNFEEVFALLNIDNFDLAMYYNANYAMTVPVNNNYNENTNTEPHIAIRKNTNDTFMTSVSILEEIKNYNHTPRKDSIV